MLGNSSFVVYTRPRAIPLAITMRKSSNGFPFLSHDEYGAPLGGPELCYKLWHPVTFEGVVLADLTYFLSFSKVHV